MLSWNWIIPRGTDIEKLTSFVPARALALQGHWSVPTIIPLWVFAKGGGLQFPPGTPMLSGTSANAMRAPQLPQSSLLLGQHCSQSGLWQTPRDVSVQRRWYPPSGTASQGFPGRSQQKPEGNSVPCQKNRINTIRRCLSMACHMLTGNKWALLTLNKAGWEILNAKRGFWVMIRWWFHRPCSDFYQVPWWLWI